MRKLLPVPVVASLMAIPPALASPDDSGLGDLPALGDVPALVAVSSVPASPRQERLSDVPPLRPAPSTFAGSEGDRSDNHPSLISSSVAGDPLDHQEASDRLRAATRGAREVARRRAAAEVSQPVVTGQPAPADPIPAVTDVPPQLEAIAACESGGNPSAIGGGGAYRGKYQFTPAAWQAVGGSGDPAAAPEAEQDRRAAILYAQSGSSQWPVCGG